MVFYHPDRHRDKLRTRGYAEDAGKRSGFSGQRSAFSRHVRVLSRRPNAVRESGQSGLACSPITLSRRSRGLNGDHGIHFDK